MSLAHTIKDEEFLDLYHWCHHSNLNTCIKLHRNFYSKSSQRSSRSERSKIISYYKPPVFVFWTFYLVKLSCEWFVLKNNFRIVLVNWKPKNLPQNLILTSLYKGVLHIFRFLRICSILLLHCVFLLGWILKNCKMFVHEMQNILIFIKHSRLISL